MSKEKAPPWVTALRHKIHEDVKEFRGQYHGLFGDPPPPTTTQKPPSPPPIFRSPLLATPPSTPGHQPEVKKTRKGSH